MTEQTLITIQVDQDTEEALEIIQTHYGHQGLLLTLSDLVQMAVQRFLGDYPRFAEKEAK